VFFWFHSVCESGWSDLPSHCVSKIVDQVEFLKYAMGNFRVCIPMCVIHLYKVEFHCIRKAQES